jgi:hypothetical protein
MSRTSAATAHDADFGLGMEEMEEWSSTATNNDEIVPAGSSGEIPPKVSEYDEWGGGGGTRECTVAQTDSHHIHRASHDERSRLLLH